MKHDGANRKKGRLNKWATTPRGWMGAESQHLSPMTIMLVLVGPGFMAFVVVEALLGFWAGLMSFLVLELGVLALIRRDYTRNKAEEGPRAETPSKKGKKMETDQDRG